MEFQIQIAKSAASELQELRAYERRHIIDEIEELLTNEPTKATRNRKQLSGVSPGFEHVPPVWELRVGEYRVFYDVNEEDKIVVVRAVRQKPQNKRTEDIIQ